MTNKFSCFLTQKGRWLTATLFLLFSLGIGNVWGAVTPGNADSKYLNIANYSTLESTYSGAASYSYDSEHGVLVVLPAAFTRYGTSQNWCTNNSGWTSNKSWNAPSENVFNGKAYYNSSSNAPALSVKGTQSTPQEFSFRVSNCTEVRALVNSSNTSRTISMTVYPVTGANYDTRGEAAGSDSDHSNAVKVLKVNGLSASSVYEVYITSNSSSESLVYELAFFTPVSSGPSVSGFSPVSGSEVGASQTITITGSTGSTIYYKWATSAQTADAIYNSGSGDRGTADAASATTTVESGKTLYAIARKGTTNSTVAYATYTIDVTAPTLSSSTPANNATNIATSGNIVLTFSENVSINDASKFTLSGGTLNTAGATVSGAAVTIPYSGLTEGTEYTFSTAAGAVKDGANNTSAALSDITFTTATCAISSCGNATITYTINASTEVTNTAANLLSANPDVSNMTALGTPVAASAVALSTIGISSDSNKGKAAAKTSACYPTAPTMSSKIGMFNGEAYSSSNYLQFAFTVNSGYTFTPCDIQFTVQPVSNTGYFRWEVTDGTTSYGYGTGEAGVGSSAGATVLTGLTSTSEMADGTYYIRLYPYYNGSNTFRISNNVILKGTTAEATPASGYAITKGATNGTIAVTDGTDAITSADAGDEVSIAATPAMGYGFTSWSVYKTGEAETTVTLADDDDADNKTRKFTMPAYPVTVSATFTAINYTLTHSAATGGSYTIKVGEATATDDNTTANYGQTITLTPTPDAGYKLSAWDVYKTGEATTKVSVTNNQFTMPDYAVTVSATFAEATELYDYSVMENKSFTDEEVTGDVSGKSKTFGTEGNPRLVVTNAGWDKKDNIINSFIKFFGGTSSMSVVIPTGRKATVTIKYGSYSTGKYLLVNGTEQTHPLKALDNSITTSNLGTYMPTVELTNQTGTLVLNSNGSGNNIYIAYVDVVLTGYASYGVTYHLNDGAWDGDAGAATYTYGTGIATLASNVAKEGCDFAGWYGNEGLTGDAITSIANNVTGDKELWAKWTPKSYTLTWDWNGGSCSATEGDDYTAHGSVAYGTTLVYPGAATMSKENTAFAGWSTDAATMPAEALTITAQWAPSHAITYTETKGAANSNPALYIEGVGVASFEPLADVANFHFTGWSPTSIGTDADEDVDVTAQWVAAYDVTFDKGSATGTTPDAFQKWEGAKFNLPGQGSMVAPTNTVFDGWKANGAGVTLAANTEYTMTAAAVEFVAQWKPVIKLVNYDGENYSINTTNFFTGGTLVDGSYLVDGTTYTTGVQIGSKSSLSFDNNTQFVAYTATTTATSVRIAIYNTNGSARKYKVAILREEANGDITKVQDTEYTLPAKSGNVYTWAKETFDLTGRSTIYIYEPSNGGSIRICQVEVVESGAQNNLQAPALDYSVNLNKGRMFLTAGEATTFEGITYKLPAKYQPNTITSATIKTCGTDYISVDIPTGQTRQIQITAGGSDYVVSKTLGDNTDSKKINGNQNVNLDAGTWYINPQGSNVNITNIVFAAAPAQKTVTFKDGASTLDTKYVWSGDKVSAIDPAPTKSGYRFVKWQLSGADYDFNTAVTADIVLDAVWQKTWTVTFNSNGGSDVDPVVVDNGATVAAPDPAPTKVGHDFVEWQLNSAAYDFATAVTADIELVATWEVAQTDASLSALSYNSNAIDVNSAVDVSGVQTYTVHLPWGSSINAALISVTKSAESASLSSIVYNSENKQATFQVESGNHSVVVNYAIQFVIDPKRGTSIVKAVISGGDQSAGFDATGIYGDKGYGYTHSNKKLDKADKYVGVKLLAGKTFAAGDKLFVVTSEDATGGYIELYEEAAGTTLIKATGVRDASAGIEIPSELVGHSEFYIVRKASTGEQSWNGFVDYVEVTREMAPAIKSFKFGENAATINEAAKTIAIEVPYATDVTALTPTIEAYGNNGATYTPSGATDFTSPVDYVVTDAYSEFSTTYAVTVSKAAPSENANLASLAVAGYSLDFDPAVVTYNVVLDYGTTVLPAITYEVADQVSPATAVKVEGGVNGATTITVTPQAGVGYKKVYTINFSVSTTQKIVIYDGTTDMNFVAESDSYLVTWESVGTDGTKQNSGATINGKDYAHNIKVFGGATSSSRTMDITIPENYVAKFYLAACSNSDSEVDIYITKDAVGAKADAVVSVTGDRTHPTWSQSDYLLPGHYFLNATNSTRLYELSVQLYPIDEERAMTQGRFGTICYPNGGRLLGAMLLEIAYFDPGQKKIFFDEVIGGQMVAGAPYLFLPNEGVDKFAIVYTDNVNAPAGHHNGLYGSYTQEELTADGNHYIMLNNQYCKVVAANTYVGANRAYILLDKIGNDYVAPAYGRRRVSLGVQQAEVATGLEDLNVGDQPIKIMINGQMYILRGEKMYDATGRLVK